MPRPERPVDPTAGPVQRFAAELRKLRAEAGGPPYREMARRAHASKASLSAAASGHRLPTWEVTKAYVRACGGDVAEWSARWSAIRDEVAPTVPAKTPPPAGGRTSTPILRPHPARRYALAAAAAVLVGAGLTAWGLVADAPDPAAESASRLAEGPVFAPPPSGPWESATGGQASTEPTARFVGGTEPVADNRDPKKTGCAADPSTIEDLDRVQVNTADENLLGVAVLRHARSCHASWGRFEPSARLMYLSGPVRVTIVAQRPATGTVGTPFTAEFDGQPVFGDILLDRTGCVAITVRVEAPDGGGSATTACKR
jgi:hypothetical protein